jgi:hypothetical protein
VPPEQLGKAFRIKNQHTDDATFDIGDPDATDFVPRLHMRKWGGECDFKITYDDKHIPASKKSISLNGDKVHWKSPDLELRYYTTEPRTYMMRHPQRISDAPFPEPNGENGLLVADIPFSQNDQGGLELEVILNAKPQSNTLSFDFETKQLKWYVQPPLHPDHPTWSDDNGDGEADNFRPENCVDSIVAFHATRGNFHEGMATAQKYKCGIAFTIYRPKAVDANGVETWCAQELENNKYSITVPQDFLDAATYPVTIDPSFGTTSVGGSTVTIEASMKATLFTSPAFAITIFQIDAYVTVTNTAKDVNTCAYLHSDLSKKVQGTSASVAASAGWVRRPTTPYTLAASTDYLLTAWSSSTTTNGLISYAVGQANVGHTNALAYNATFPTPFVVTAHTTNNHSIFASYLRFVEPLPFVDKLTTVLTRGAATYTRAFTEPIAPLESKYGGSNKTLSQVHEELFKDPLPFAELWESPWDKLSRTYAPLLKDPLLFADMWKPSTDYWAKLGLCFIYNDPLPFAALWNSPADKVSHTYAQLLNDPLLFIDLSSWLYDSTYSKTLTEAFPLIEATAGTALIDVYSKTFNEPLPLTDMFSKQLSHILAQAMNEPMPFIDLGSKASLGAATYSRLLIEPLPFADILVCVKSSLYAYVFNEPLPFADVWKPSTDYWAKLGLHIQLNDPLPFADMFTHAAQLTYTQTMFDPMSVVDVLTKSGAFAYSQILSDPLPLVDVLAKALLHIYSRNMTEPMVFIFSGAYTETIQWIVNSLNEPMPFVDLLATNLKVPAFSQILREALPFVDVLTRNPTLTYSQLFNDPLPLTELWKSPADKISRTYERLLKDLLPFTDLWKPSTDYWAKLGLHIQLNDPLPLVDKIMNLLKWSAYIYMFNEPLPFVDRLAQSPALTYRRIFNDPLPLADIFSQSFSHILMKALAEPLPFVDIQTRTPSFTYGQILNEPLPFIDFISKLGAFTYSQLFNEPSPFVEVLTRIVAVAYTELLMEPLPFVDILTHGASLTYTQLLNDPLPFADFLMKSGSFAYSQFLKDPSPFTDVLTKELSHILSRNFSDPLILIEALSTTAIGVFYTKMLTEALSFIDRLTPTYFEGCLDYDYMVSVFDALARIASGRSIARELERRDP